jgi:hypothetical protein
MTHTRKAELCTLTEGYHPDEDVLVEVIGEMKRLETVQVDARNHLYTALIQVMASDDQIIIGHMRSAYRALGGDLDALDAKHEVV